MADPTATTATAGKSCSPDRIPGLDGLRALAALGVTIGHSTKMPGFPRSAALVEVVDIWRGLSVPLFFVLSGFLITALMVGEEHGNGSVSLPRFYARRALRILPASLVFLLGMAVVNRLAGLHVRGMDFLAAGFWFRNLYDHPWSMTGVDAYAKIRHYTAHFWSLSVEEHFYLVWPALFVWLGRGKRFGPLLALLAILPVWRVCNMYRFGVGGMNHWRTDLIADYILCGALLAVARDRWGMERIRTWVGWAGLPCLGLLLALELVGIHGPSTGPVWRVLTVTRISVECLGLVCVVAWAAAGGASRLHRVLEHPVLRWLGQISFSLYLWQQPFSGELLPAVFQTFPWNLGWSLAAATTSHYLVERPFLRLRSRFRHDAAPAETSVAQ